MKNKGFTTVEAMFCGIIGSLIFIIILYYINITWKLVFSTLCYFCFPAIVSGIFLKLNQKHKWIVAAKHENKYIFKNKYIVSKYNIHRYVWWFLIAWPISISGLFLIVISNEIYHRYIKNRFHIPVEDQNKK